MNELYELVTMINTKFRVSGQMDLDYELDRHAKYLKYKKNNKKYATLEELREFFKDAL